MLSQIDQAIVEAIEAQDITELAQCLETQGVEVVQRWNRLEFLNGHEIVFYDRDNDRSNPGWVMGSYDAPQPVDEYEVIERMLDLASQV
jgi:hypothetical protein